MKLNTISNPGGVVNAGCYLPPKLKTEEESLMLQGMRFLQSKIYLKLSDRNRRSSIGSCRTVAEDLQDMKLAEDKAAVARVS